MTWILLLMATVNIFNGETEATTFRRPDTNLWGFGTEYPADSLVDWPVIKAPLKYGVNTQEAAADNSKIIADLGQKYDGGVTIELAHDSVTWGNELPWKIVNTRRELLPFCIRGARPDVKLININKDAPAAFWYDNHATPDPSDDISYHRYLARQRFENLQISSKSKGIYIRGIPNACSFSGVHFLGCTDWALHLADIFRVALSDELDAEFCGGGFKLERCGQVETGLLSALRCGIGVHFDEVGIGHSSINGEHCSEWNVLLDRVQCMSLAFYQEGALFLDPPIPAKSKFTRCRDVNFMVAKQTLDSWPLELDDETKQNCLFNFSPIMAQTKFNVGFVVRAGITVTSPPPPDMTIGEPVSYQFTATGGSGAYTWAVTSGALPPGLSLAPSGAVSGIPTQAGNFQAEITVSG